MTTVNLKNNDTYMQSCLRIASERLGGMPVSEIGKNIRTINAYPNRAALEPPRGIEVLEDTDPQDMEKAKECVLAGRFLAEHAAAGEATRLGLGTKYLITVARDLTEKRLAQLISEEKKCRVTPEEVILEAGCRPSDLLPVSLGARHMLQYSFDICRLAEEKGVDAGQALSRQKLIVVLNQNTAQDILNEFTERRFFGFSPANTYFMVQRSYHGIATDTKRFWFDEKSEKRLHNHGQMVMQETMDNELFVLEKGQRRYLLGSQVHKMLSGLDDKLSYNIEDLGFLVGSIDYESLAKALSAGRRGFNMVMEIVANNPDNPQKGGMAAYDPVLGRNVMIEAFQLEGISNSNIKFLNKNFNHYPGPAAALQRVRKNGLPMPLCVKADRIYFEPVQGDINFLVRTLFVRRRLLKPIQAWKSPATAPLAIRYMKEQDSQPGWPQHIAKFGY